MEMDGIEDGNANGNMKGCELGHGAGALTDMHRYVLGLTNSSGQKVACALTFSKRKRSFVCDLSAKILSRFNRICLRPTSADMHGDLDPRSPPVL